MKKIIFSGLFLFAAMGFIGKAGAVTDYYVTQSTAVLYSSGTPFVLTEVYFSTGNGSSFAMVVDSVPLSIGTLPSLAAFQNTDQWVVPPHQLVFSTQTVNGQDKWTAPDGGVVIKNGLVILQSAVGGRVGVYTRGLNRNDGY